MVLGGWSVAGCSSDEGSKKQTHIVGKREERMPVRSEFYSLRRRDGHWFYRQKRYNGVGGNLSDKYHHTLLLQLQYGQAHTTGPSH